LRAHQSARQLGGEAVHHELGETTVLVVRPPADGDAAHPGGSRGPDAIGRVLDHDGVRRCDLLGAPPVDLGQRGGEALGVRLANPDLVNRDDYRNRLGETGELQDVLDLRPEGARRDRHGNPGGESANERDRVRRDRMAVADRRSVALDAGAEKAIRGGGRERSPPGLEQAIEHHSVGQAGLAGILLSVEGQAMFPQQVLVDADEDRLVLGHSAIEVKDDGTGGTHLQAGRSIGVILPRAALLASVESDRVTRVLLTGATRGIGRAAAVELARQGAEVAIVGREAGRVTAVAAEAMAAGRGAPVHEHVADLTLMSDVRALAAEARGRYEHIDVLANNAGALFASRKVTSEGFEHTFALNHLAPFLLTNLLRDLLDGGRVVTTASDAHKSGLLDLDDVQSEQSYSAMGVYGTSKLCNILFTRELARRAPELQANCFHPGVVRTGFGKNDNGIWKVITTVGAPFFRSPQRGARSLVWLALSDDAAGLTGEYVQDEKVIAPNAQAQDDTLAARLWERSAELVGLPPTR